MPVGVLGQSDPSSISRRSLRGSTVTNACRRFGSVGPRGMPCGPALCWTGHQCLSAFWVSRTREEAKILRAAYESPMPVGVLGQSDSKRITESFLWNSVTNACRRFGSVGLSLFELYLIARHGHQCLSAFWVSRTRLLFCIFYKTAERSPMPVGVLGQSDFLRKILAKLLSVSPMPVGVLGQSDLDRRR